MFSLAAAADFVPPAGDRYPRVAAAASILPGGRVIQPLGVVIPTGPGPFALALSAKGVVATADTGPDRFGLTLMNNVKGAWSLWHLWARTPFSRAAQVADLDWQSVAAGIAFETERSIWVSEGDSGRVRLVDTSSGARQRIADLNRGEWRNSYPAALAVDAAHRFLYVLDRTNNRMAVVDAKKAQVVASVRTGKVPFAIALAPGGEAAYVTNSGDGTLTVIDVRDPLKPEAQEAIPVGDAPSGVLAVGDSVFVANSGSDSISLVSPGDHKVVGEIALRVPGLDSLRGIAPCGMAFDAVTGWLLVAEAGINAVGVIDTRKNALIAHIPAGLYPTAVLVAGDRVYVANARGRGTGPSVRRPLLDLGEEPFLHRGTVTTFIMPNASELPKLTGLVYAAGGLAPVAAAATAFPAEIDHVVWIVKRSRSFDEVLGDVPRQAGVALMAAPQLARFGMRGRAEGDKTRFSIHEAVITPNQHGIAERWTFSDNFYADGESDAEGFRRLAGLFPGPAAESAELAFEGGRRRPEPEPSAGALWDHLRAHGISFRNFSEGTPAEESDQDRADRFIMELEERYGPGKQALPSLLYLVLPNDGVAEVPASGERYPYEASYVADNDLALGRILESLSKSPWWRGMTVFVTEASASGGLDHVDSHRTMLLAAGPWVRKGFVTHANADFAALLRTTLGLLHAPPMSMADATAAPLNGIFTTEPDFAPYAAELPDKRIFAPAR